jgi:hypothetical protein
MPDDADELHSIAGLLFGNPHSLVLGVQLLFETNTGLRTFEILKWGPTSSGPTLRTASLCMCGGAKGNTRSIRMSPTMRASRH